MVFLGGLLLQNPEPHQPCKRDKEAADQVVEPVFQEVLSKTS